MRDYWMTQSLLQVMGWGYVAVVLIALLIAAWAPRRNPHKALWVLIVLGVGSILPIKSYRQYEEQKQTGEARKQQYTKAKALFDERCKTAGEKIYKSIENVEGVLLLNIRSPREGANYYDANWPDAALPNQFGGEEYVGAFLTSWKVEQFQPSGRELSKTEKESFINQTSSYLGYKFVDVKESDGKIFRYQISAGKIVKEPLGEPAAQYAISYQNLDDPIGRENWIAGTMVTIKDSRINEVIAQKIWYSFEGGFGSREGDRMPWLFAVTCPKQLGQDARYPTQLFSRKVLK
ncbi:hypothetical protein AVKW3434_23730 [Acidovorax sp. SUPP3434]|uniref:hypothetical protein n=1 Tax=Acidovorax sp. SUPP3434 TaxID=2920880 RepID=UPI0023DE2135|nr:hypothetical protein [Acidovorax sp. SUPP3434]GKT02457.1 hypothetical protein AVKW3434_23730 [Acidovorax sp. SUPP3434]